MIKFVNSKAERTGLFSSEPTSLNDPILSSTGLPFLVSPKITISSDNFVLIYGILFLSSLGKPNIKALKKLILQFLSFNLLKNTFKLIQNSFD